MGKFRAEASGLDFRGAQRVYDNGNRQRAADGVAYLEAIHQVLRLRGSRTCDVEQRLVVAYNLRQGDETLLVVVGAGNRNIEEFGGGERCGLWSFGGLNPVRIRHYIHFFADFLNVIQSEGEIRGACRQLNGLLAQDEEAHFLHSHGVITRRKIRSGKVAGVVGES